MGPISFVAIAAAAFVAMEGLAWLTHRYIMHGPLWSLHQSHHHPRAGLLERNDLFAIAFALPAVALFAAQGLTPWALPLACGVSAYGIAYALLHDGLVHRRIAMPFAPRAGYLGRLIVAHHLHHAVHTRDGAVSFGFLYAPPPDTLRRRLRQLARGTVMPQAAAPE